MKLLAGIYKRVCPFCEGKLEFPFTDSPLVYCPKCQVYTGAKLIPKSLWDGEHFVLVKKKITKEVVVFT